VSSRWVLIGAAALAGCGSTGEATTAVPPGCESVAPKVAHALPRELPRPSVDPIAAEARSVDGTSIVQGFVARLPSQVLTEITRRPGLRVLASEDEGNDAELTVSDGRSRTAYKLVRACAHGSRFTAVIVPEVR
jgi:hypothetical protein